MFKGLPLKCAENWKNHIFHVYFFNMDISFIMRITGMTIAIHVAGICLKGSVSQNIDKGLSFCFILCSRLNSCFLF